MTLIKWNNNSHRAAETGRLFPSTFTDLFEGFLSNDLTGGKMANAVPSVNISETSEHFKIDLAAPGMDKGDFKVEVDNDVLSVSGERKEETKEENVRFTRREFSYGSFKRSFTLPESADGDKTNVRFENGVLTLTIPKKEEAKRRGAKEIKIS